MVSSWRETRCLGTISGTKDDVPTRKIHLRAAKPEAFEDRGGTRDHGL